MKSEKKGKTGFTDVDDIDWNIYKEKNMKINGKEYIKVRNAQEHEVGRAYKENEKLILDNDLGKIKAGSVIKINQDRDIIEYEG